MSSSENSSKNQQIIQKRKTAKIVIQGFDDPDPQQNPQSIIGSSNQHISSSFNEKGSNQKTKGSKRGSSSHSSLGLHIQMDDKRGSGNSDNQTQGDKNNRNYKLDKSSDQQNDKKAEDKDNPTDQNNQGQAKRKYYDDTRVQQMLKRFTKLEQHGDDGLDGQSSRGGPQKLDADEFMKQFGMDDSDSQKINPSSTNNGNNYQSTMLHRFEKKLRTKLFQINFFLLKHQIVTVSMYHVILLIEFLQQVFFVLNGQTIVDEYAPKQSSSSEDSAMVDDTLNNSTLFGFDEQLDDLTSQQQSLLVQESNFAISDYLKYLNLQLDVLHTNTTSSYLTVYVGLCIVFMSLILVTFTLSKGMFDSVKNDSIKDGSKMIIKALSFLMILFLTVFQTPFTTTLLEGYLCQNEDELQDYIVDQTICQSTMHKFYCITSSVFLFFYYSFLLVQLQLFTSSNPDGDIPWSGFERNLLFVNMIIKFVLSATFVFETPPGSQTQAITHLGCAIVQAYTVYHRYQEALLFVYNVHLAILSYETLLICLFFSVPIHKLSGGTLSTSTFVLLIILSLLITTLLIYRQTHLRIKLLCQEGYTKLFKNERSTEQYLVHLYLQVKDAGHSHDYLIVDGIFSNHLECCDDKGDCRSQILADSIDGLKEWQKEKENKQRQENIQRSATQKQEERSGNTLLDQSDDQLGREVNQKTIIKERRQLSKRFEISDNGVLQVAHTIVSQQASLKDEIQAEIESIQSRHINRQAQQDLSFMSKTEKTQNTYFQIPVPLEPFSTYEFDPQHLQKKYFNFLGNQIFGSIVAYPKTIKLRILSSFLQRNRLGNYFKSIFDLMNCDLLQPTLQEKFMIFRGKLEIQQALIQQHQKNVQKVGYVDADRLFSYEKQV